MDKERYVISSLEVPIRGSYDAVVCGGGPAGCTAAIAAARNGLRTAIVEEHAFFGGLATAGLVAPISEFRKNGRLIVDGIPWEIMERLAAEGGADLSWPIGNVPYDPEIYKLVLQKMLLEAGVTPYLGVTLVSCTGAPSLQTVACMGKEGLFALEGSAFLDCTGDAVLCHAAGTPFLPAPDPAQCQPATLCFRLGGVDTQRLEGIYLREQNTKYANARIRKILEDLRFKEEVPNFGGPWFCWAMRHGVVNVNMTRAPAKLETPEASYMECRLREDVFRFTDLLRHHVPEFRNCYLMETAMQAGYRESRRIAGAHVLSGEELLAGICFPDTVACTAHPVDIHCALNREQNVTFLSHEGFIPYRSLVIPKWPNLWAAGRCISANRNAFASTRVQAPSMATGQAAGTAAALCVKNGWDADQLDGALLREVLSRQGAFTGLPPRA